MEFNDSRVSDYKFADLDNDVFGEDKGTKTTTYGSYGTGYYNMGGGDDTYGKSAYMLFYERRRKKDMKIVIADDKVEEEK